MDLSVLATSTPVVLASIGSGDGEGGSIGLLLLLSGFVFYGLMYLRYRNTDKRHRHESETRAEIHDVRALDQFHRSLKGVSNSRMRGANNREVRGARRGITQTLGGLGQG